MHHFVLQTTSRDCGWACLKMLLADASKNEAYLTLPGSPLKGPLSFLDLVTMAGPYGLTLEGYKVTCKSEVFKTLGSFIALGENQGKSHYVIVDKVHRRTVSIRDPSSGSYRMKKEEFLHFFSGNFLIVSGWENPKEALPKSIGLPKKMRFFLYLWQCLSAFFLLAGLSSVNVNRPFVVPVILFAVYFFMELAYKASLLKAMGYLDRTFVVGKMKNLTKDYRSSMHMLYELKSALIATPLGFITHLMTVLAFIIILGLNGWNNVLLIGFVAVVIIVERIAWVPHQNRKARQIGVLEENLLDGMTKNRLETDVEEGFGTLHKATYLYAMEEEVRKYVFYFALLAAVLIAMGLSGNVSLNYLVFHFMALAFLSENIRAMMDFSKKQDKLRLLVNRYHALK